MNTDRIDAESSVVSFKEMAGNCENESKKEKTLQTCQFFLFFFTRKPCKHGVDQCVVSIGVQILEYAKYCI